VTYRINKKNNILEGQYGEDQQQLATSYSPASQREGADLSPHSQPATPPLEFATYQPTEIEDNYHRINLIPEEHGNGFYRFDEVGIVLISVARARYV